MEGGQGGVEEIKRINARRKLGRDKVNERENYSLLVNNI